MAEFAPDGALAVKVSDTGVGIAAENIPMVMQPFAQIESDLSRAYQGTGLGLPLSKSLAELHGGSLSMDSDLGVGTTVTLRLPAERLAAARTVATDVEDGGQAALIEETPHRLAKARA